MGQRRERRRAMGVGLLLFAIGCGGVGAVQSADPPSNAGGDALESASFETELEAFLAHDRHGSWSEVRCAESAEGFRAHARASGSGDDAIARRAQAFFMAGMAEQRCGHRAAAERDYRAALRVDPDHCSARVGLGLARHAAGRADQAEQAFRLATERDPRCVEGFVNLGILERRRRDFDAALRDLRRALTLESGHAQTLEELALVHFERAEDDVTALDQAELVCRQAFALHPERASLHNTWGMVNAQQGRLVEALARFERAFTRDPDLFEAWMNFGQITLSFRGYVDAERAFREAVRIAPGDYDARIGLGVALRGLGRDDEAESEYFAASAIDAERPEAWFNLGVLEQEHRGGSPEELARAVTHFERFVDKARDEATYRDQVEEVSRCCPEGGARECRPGRLQNLRAALRAHGVRAHGC